MADIFDIVGTAIQLADLAVGNIKNCIGYYKNVREAPTEAKTMRAEVYSFLSILDDLQIALQKDKEISIPGIRPDIQSIEEEFKKTRVLLEEVENYTRPENTQGRRRLTWPLSRDPVRNMIRRIQIQKENLIMLLLGAIKFKIQERADF